MLLELWTMFLAASFIENCIWMIKVLKGAMTRHYLEGFEMVIPFPNEKLIMITIIIIILYNLN